MMTRQDIAHAVSATLGDHADDYDIDAIVGEITTTRGPIATLDDVPTDDYWALVERHDTTAEA